MDHFYRLRSLLEGHRHRKRMTREQLANVLSNQGVSIEPEDIRHMEVRCRRPPDPTKLRAVAMELEISYAELSETVATPEGLGLEKW